MLTKQSSMPKLVALSLGAGVQSTTLYLMACHGLIEPKPDAAVFADTGWEPDRVYRHLEWLRGLGLSVPIATVGSANIREETLSAQSGKRFSSLPFFIKDVDGKGSMMQRQCTKDYKIMPVRRHLRAMLEKDGPRRLPAGSVELWMGISLDEIVRMKQPDVKWIRHRWPLVEQRMTRHGCLNWMRKHGYPEPPKSSCVGCPFHSNKVWLEMKQGDPESWADAVNFDRRIREKPLGRLRGDVYLHRSMVPLELVILDNQPSQGDLFDGFGNECEGMCGV